MQHYFPTLGTATRTFLALCLFAILFGVRPAAAAEPSSSRCARALANEGPGRRARGSGAEERRAKETQGWCACW